VAFPVLVYNAIDWLADAHSGLVDARPGERWVIPRQGGAAAPWAEGPVPVQLTTLGATLAVDGMTRSGIYRVHDGDEVVRIAASLSSEQESDLRRSTSLKGRGEERVAELWSILALAGLGLLLLEWQLYHRRVTR
jgi:hypothetical protein